MGAHSWVTRVCPSPFREYIRIITLIYFLAFLLSIVCLYLGTISQLHKYELERIKTKSDVKRGMSLFPTFPLTSIIYLLFLYFLNSYKDDLGTYLVCGYGICVSIIHLFYFSYYKYQIGKCSSWNETGKWSLKAKHCTPSPNDDLHNYPFQTPRSHWWKRHFWFSFVS